MRIAYFSPLSPQPTGIADYSEELLPCLARHAELDLFVDDYQPGNPAIVEQFEVFNHRRFSSLQRRRRYDVCLYHMGNSPLHEYIYNSMLHYPGITVLHDYVLHEFFEATTLGRGQPAAYVREMGYCYGWQGFALAHWAMHHSQAFSGYCCPLADRVVDASLGLIVHSDFLKQLVTQSHPNVPIAKVNLPFSPEGVKGDLPDPGQLRVPLGLRDDQFVVASFGRIAPSKRIDVALRAFARFRQAFPQAIYLLVGEVIPLYDVEGLIHELALEDAVVSTDHVDMDDFQRYMATADVCVNLRYPTAGEMSASLIRTMGAGKPVIVSDVGAFSELPNGCCLKVSVGPEEEDTLLAHLLTLARDPVLRRQMGANAQRHVEAHHHVADSAREYVSFIEQCLEFIKHPALRSTRLSIYRAVHQPGFPSGTP